MLLMRRILWVLHRSVLLRLSWSVLRSRLRLRFVSAMLLICVFFLLLSRFRRGFHGPILVRLLLDIRLWSGLRSCIRM